MPSAPNKNTGAPGSGVKPTKTNTVPAAPRKSSNTDVSSMPLPEPEAVDQKQDVAHHISVTRLPGGGLWLKEHDQVIRQFKVMIPKEHTEKDYLDPQYWIHHCKRVPPLSLIVAMDELRRYEVHLRVLERGENFLRVTPLVKYTYTTMAKSSPEREAMRKQFRVEYIDQQGWRVVTKDHKIIVDGLLSQDEADQYVSQHVDRMHPVAA